MSAAISPTLSSSSSTGLSLRSSVSSAGTASASVRGPPPPLPHKPVHLTLRSKSSPYAATASPALSPVHTGTGEGVMLAPASRHSHWDSQATIRGAPPPLRSMDTGASAADSFFSSYTSSLHSREPSLLLPDETGMGAAGFAMASSPSGFLHQHNAHAIATATVKAAGTSTSDTVRSRPMRSNISTEMNDEDDVDSDDVEDIDSFLGDDTPQQVVASPRRVTATFSSPPQTTDAPSAPMSASPPTSPAAPAPVALGALLRPTPVPTSSAPVPSPPPPSVAIPGVDPESRPDPRLQEQGSETTEAPQEANEQPEPSADAQSPPHVPVAEEQASREPTHGEPDQVEQERRVPEAPSQSFSEATGVADRLVPGLPDQTTLKSPLIPRGMPARALFAFQGEPNSNELSLAAGQEFEVLDPNLASGWSLGVVRAQNGDGVADQRGLVPNGWYCFTNDFQMAPPPTDKDERVTSANSPPSKTTAPTPTLANPLANLFRISRASMAGGQRYPTPVADQAIPEEVEGEEEPASTERCEEATATQTNEDDRFQAWLKSTASSGSYGNPNLPRHTSSSASPQDTLASSGRGQEPATGLSSGADNHVRVEDRHRGPVQQESDPSATLKVARVSDASASPVLVASSSGIEIRPSTAAEPLSASASAIATTTNGTAPSKPGYLASLLAFGGKGFHRSGPFAASGAEDWISCTEAGAGIEAPSTGNESLDQDTEGDEGSGSAFWGRGTVRGAQDISALSLSSLSRSARKSKGDITQHMIVSGPAGPRWKTRSPPFHVQVHSPIKKKKLNGMHEYTLYTVTSTYPPVDLGRSSSSRRGGSGSGDRSRESEIEVDPEMEYAMPYDPTTPPEPAGHTLTVLRRFTHFAWLSRILAMRYPALVLPPLPSKQYAGRFSSDFIETRRADLDLWLSRVVRHPIARYEEALIFFLSEDDPAEWKRREAELEAVPKVEIVSGIGPTGAYSTVGRKGVPVNLANGTGSKTASTSMGTVKSVVTLEGAPTFFASTFHPDFNLDVSDAAAEARALERFSEAYERAMLLEPGGGLSGALHGPGGATNGRATGAGGGGTVGASASMVAESAGPNAIPPKGYPAAGAVGVLPAWRGLRETTALSANSYRDLSFALLRLLTGRGLGLQDDQPPASSPVVNGSTSGSHGGAGAGPGSRGPKDNHWLNAVPGLGKRPATGACNEEGGWCWREGCTECVALTKSLQYMAQSLQHVADEYEDHTRTALMRQHERLKAIGRPRLSIDKLLEVHHATTLKYREATGETVEELDNGPVSQSGGRSVPISTLTQTERELMAARCETVLNVTMSEMDRIHQERTEDWTAWGKHWLDDEIAHHERCLETLRNARAAFEPESWEYYAREGPVMPTSYDSELYATRRSAFPIPMPSAPYAPPGVAATALRPVSLATEVVREGVTKFTYLFGSSSSSPSPSPAAAAVAAGVASGSPTWAADGYGPAADLRREAAAGVMRGSPLLSSPTPGGVMAGGPASPHYHEHTTRGYYQVGGDTVGGAGTASSPSSAAWPGADQLLTLRAHQHQHRGVLQQQQPDAYGKVGGGAYHPNGAVPPPPPPPPPPPAPQPRPAPTPPHAQTRGHAQAVPTASSLFSAWR